MSRPAIIGIGSCVIEALMRGIRMAVGDRADVHAFQNQGNSREQVGGDWAGRAAVVIEEASPWSGYSALSAEERAAIPEGVPILKVPTAHFNSLWPLLFNDPRNQPEEGFPWGRFPFARSDRLAAQIRTQLPEAGNVDRIARYHDTALGSIVDVQRNHDFETINLFAREEGCDVRVAAYIVAEFRSRRLFYTHHHPAPDLLAFMMVQLFGHSALADYVVDSPDDLLTSYRAMIAVNDPFGGDEMPIHPEVASHFGLGWWKPDSRYAVFGGHVTFDEWLALYMDHAPAPALQPTPA